MLKVYSKNYVRPDQKEAYFQLAKRLIDESRNEEGCISYDLYQDVQNPNALIFMEEWVSESHLKAHMASSHFTSIVPDLRTLCDKEKEVSAMVKAY